eukprot:scaffold503722_cov47-Prasinocladus_malaysianus.AAC.1
MSLAPSISGHHGISPLCSVTSRRVLQWRQHHHKVGGKVTVLRAAQSKNGASSKLSASKTIAADSAKEPSLASSEHKVAYQGLHGAFCEEAVYKALPTWTTIPCEGFETVFQ